MKLFKVQNKQSIVTPSYQPHNYSNAGRNQPAKYNQQWSLWQQTPINPPSMDLHAVCGVLWGQNDCLLHWIFSQDGL